MRGYMLCGLVFAAMVTLGAVNSASAQYYGQPGYGGNYDSGYGYGNCPPWRPCGPGNSFGGNLLVRQGFRGADYRPACANHDACLAAGGNRKDCDRQYLSEMECACNSSANPILCRMKARQMYLGVRLFGWMY